MTEKMKTDEQITMEHILTKWLHRVQEDTVQFIGITEKRAVADRSEDDYVTVTATFYLPRGSNIP